MPDALIVAQLRRAGCVFAEDEARVLVSSAGTPAELASMVDRRVAGEPLEYIVGWAEFCGRRIAVEPGVFVPRRRTEFLVRQATRLAPAGAVVVDLCCGSGAVGAVLRAAVDRAEVYAVDIDPVAVRCARRNLAAVPASGAFSGAFSAAFSAAGAVYQGDLYQPLPARLHGRVDVVVANVPYVPTGELELMPPEARDHEPRVALDGGPDGLDLVRRLAAGASPWLVPGGHLLVETSQAQAPAAVRAFAGHGLAVQVAADEELGATVVIGTAAGPGWPAAPPIETERLVLEPVRVEHADEMAAVLDDVRLHEFTGGRPSTRPELRERYARWLSHAGLEGWLNWILRERRTGEAVGTFQVTLRVDSGRRVAELAWVVAVAYQGRGYAAEAGAAAVEWLRRNGTDMLIAHIHPSHEASMAVARRLGLQPTRITVDGEVRWRSIVDC
jgi:release factor glutamine methyltransferase